VRRDWHRVHVRTETASALDVTVVEGSVQVPPGELGESISSERFLSCAAIIDRDSNRRLAAVASAGDLDNELAWRQGKTC